jgi:hypothetical protein
VLPEKSDHVAISKYVMWIIAGMILFCLVLVLLAKGVDALPHKEWGIVAAVIFMGAALSMAWYVQRDHH